MRKDSKIREEKDKGQVVSFLPTGEYYYTKGLKALRKRELQKAKKYLSRAVDLDPLEPMIACQLAVVETELGNFEQSNGLLHFILDDLDPLISECHYFLANNYAHLGMFKEAFKHAKEYLEQDEKGEFSEDAEDLLELISLDSDDPFDLLSEQDDLITMQEEARYLLEGGSFEKAVERLDEMVEKFPDFWSAHNNLALAHFYLGDIEKAHQVLEEVLEKNPGNLHALCNLAVFMYYEKKYGMLKELVNVLRKIHPMTLDQQFKLGVTFALIGQFEDAYRWLKKLYKNGYDGEPSFYYWLSHSAYFTGHHETAKAVWKQVLKLSPEKEGQEPWNEKERTKEGFEHHVPSLVKRLNSEHEEERFFGIFLLSLTDDQKKVMSHADFCDIDTLNVHEKVYMADVLGMPIDPKLKEETRVELGHETALQLYKHFKPIGNDEAGLLMMWFSIFNEMLHIETKLKNKKALAASTEYIWRKFRGEKTSQTKLAEKYDVSASTVGKYIKYIREHLL
ncbi:tetratricopeptide (TPR) repeat protein [Bacillus ectoiniformans]|uniref:tetratricopeptide repeat protein n=1 Tax=Bacillus ectoiniformans TaxID=1494429 RepID=UPI00195DC40D|nr:tetratricopeptide repeat protein [Bacillus ectoiniformans]MBM7648751.1 tetratricopeptide (TPR) repeat protein [Bacillus ectoiniformans]